MITWMQKHKKWLIITIWISTIAFIGAGFVGWGQYSYGDKAGAVAKVGTIEITQGELQKSYSNLYAKYNQMFQGNFDKEKAKQFGLQKQALQQLIQQALLINLAKSYDLKVSDKELLQELEKLKYFFKNGVFNKETYKTVLSQNRLTTKEFEASMRKDILIQKMLKLLPIKVSKNETNILNTVLNIADKLDYKVLTQNSVVLKSSDKLLKAYWKKEKQNYMSDISYNLKYIKQTPQKESYSNAKLASYYADNKTHFKDSDGKIIAFTLAKSAITKELNAKETKNKALRTYIAFKKGRLPKETKFKSVTLSKSANPFNAKTLAKVAKLSLVSPYMKPVLVNGTYYIFELLKVNPATTKSYKNAKADLLLNYTSKMKKQKLQELANASVDTFIGKSTPFITIKDATTFKTLSQAEASEFLQNLFSSEKKRSYIMLSSGKIVLYNILEQKLLTKSNKDLASSVMKLKSAIFNQALIKELQKKYKTEIYVQGL